MKIIRNHEKKILLLKTILWAGAIADAVWTIALLFPWIFAIFIGQPDLKPELQVRLLMGLGASLMAGWTGLLVWATRNPIERRFVFLLTAFPVVSGLFIVALIGLLKNGSSNLWILIKCALLILLMVYGYILARKLEQANESGDVDKQLK